jgi:hypothetical protein
LISTIGGAVLIVGGRPNEVRSLAHVIAGPHRCYHIVALNARIPSSFRSALPQSFNCDEAKLHAPYLNPRDAIG